MPRELKVQLILSAHEQVICNDLDSIKSKMFVTFFSEQLFFSSDTTLKLREKNRSFRRHKIVIWRAMNEEITSDLN